MSEKLVEGPAIGIGDWELVSSLNLLRHAQSGDELRLEPQHVDLLVYLALHPGEVLSVDRIIDQVWERQVVTDQSVYQAIAKLRRAFGDEASAPRYIETLPKRGYRLIAPVRQGKAAAAGEAMSAEHPESDVEPAVMPRVATAGPVRRFAMPLLLLTGILVSYLFLRSGNPERIAGVDGPTTVLVAPFKALSDDPQDGLIAEGFSIELAHSVGRVDGVRVIGAVSSQLASRLEGPGRHVNADLVVSGSVRRNLDELRIAATLTEVASGVQVWSDVFDRPNRDILQTQRDVAEAIAAALHRGIDDQAADSSLLPIEQQVHDNYLLGRFYRKRRTQEGLERAAAYFDRSLAVQADFLPAMRGRAASHLLLSFYGSTPLAEALEAARPYLERGIAIAPDDAELLALIGLSHYLRGNYGIAEDFLLRAVATHANLAEAWMWLGLTRRQQGRLNDALQAFQHASGLEPLLVTAVVNYANALGSAGQPEAALKLLEELAIKANEAFVNRDQLFRELSGVARGLGQLTEAHHWAVRALEAEPGSALSQANMAVVLGLLGQDEAARRFAVEAIGDSAPGTGARDFLNRAALAAPSVLALAPWHARAEAMHTRVDTPPIEWRQASLFAGMKAFFDADYPRAAQLLQRALNGASYPVLAADDDLFACGSLVSALERSSAIDQSLQQLEHCNLGMAEAAELGWDSVSLKLGSLRLAVAAGDSERGRSLMGELFDHGFRNLSLLRMDPLLQELAASPEYARLEQQIGADISASWSAIQVQRRD